MPRQNGADRHRRGPNGSSSDREASCSSWPPTTPSASPANSAKRACTCSCRGTQHHFRHQALWKSQTAKPLPATGRLDLHARHDGPLSLGASRSAQAGGPAAAPRGSLRVIVFAQHQCIRNANTSYGTTCGIASSLSASISPSTSPSRRTAHDWRTHSPQANGCRRRQNRNQKATVISITTFNRNFCSISKPDSGIARMPPSSFVTRQQR